MSAASAPGRVGSGDGLDSPDGQGGSELLYAGLLWLYPGEFRRRYADEMVRLFADQLRDARATGRPGGTAATWFRSLIDLVANAVGEHLRKDRTMAQSLATFEPTRTMRMLGLLAMVGGVVLVAVWFGWDPFSTPGTNSVRLGLFWLAALAVAVAFHGRQASAAPRAARVATSIVVLTSLWNVAWIVLAVDRDSPFSGTFGFLGFVASFLGWLAASVYGAAVLGVRAAWRGMTRPFAIVTQLAAAILVVAGPVATFGMDRLGLTRSEPYGELFGTLGAIGVTGVGLGWILLGGVLLIANRGRTATAA